MEIHCLILCLFGVGHKKLFLIQKDHLDLKDSRSMVKKKNIRNYKYVSESENSSSVFGPLRSLLAGCCHSLTLTFIELTDVLTEVLLANDRCEARAWL